MILFPAIDLKNNTCVRLKQGDFNQVTAYSNNPSEVAQRFKDSGARYLHVVDLDGANTGCGSNLQSIREIIEKTNLPIQIGGGIRSLARVKTLLDLGVSRVIVGTIAIENQTLLSEMVQTYPNQIVVSIDAKNGKVATRGWKETTEMDSICLCKRIEEMGIKTIVYTDIAKDGMLEGPNLSIYQALIKKTNLDVIASGGVSTLNDIKRLNEMGIYGAIIGKALYEEKINLKEAITCLQNESSLV